MRQKIMSPNAFPFQNVLLVLILMGVSYLIFNRQLLFANFKNRRYMNITIRILTEDLTTQQQNIIKQALGISTKQEYSEALEKICKASFLEYCQMISASGTASKIEEIRSERLFLLIQHYFKDKFPEEREIENIFHLGTKSRVLLQNTISHYKTQLSYLNSWLLGYLNQATADGNDFQFKCTSPTIIQLLNNTVKQNWSGHELISKVQKTASTYWCSGDTYTKLKDFFKP